MKLSRKLVTAGVLLIILLTLGITWALAQASGQVAACVDSKGKVSTLGFDENVTCDPNKETKITWNIVGPPGPQGPEGPQGPQGEPGPPGGDLIIYKRVESYTCHTPGGCGGELTLIAQCDPGDVATGGAAFRETYDDDTINDHLGFPYPYDDSSDAPTGWMTKSGRLWGTTKVVAICADLTP